MERARRSKWPLAVAVMTVGGLIAIGLFLWTVAPRALGRKPYKIPSESMIPTLQVNDRVTANAHAYDDAPPRVGDIIIFHPPRGADANQCGTSTDGGAPCARAVGGPWGVSFVKRVVAVGGDTVAVRGGATMRNGRRAAEPFIRPCDQEGGTGCDFPRAVRVPRGQVFVLGDNRGESDDSRFWGPIPTSWIVGRVDDCGALALMACHPRR